MILRYTPIAALLMTSAFGALVACSSLSDPAKGTATTPVAQTPSSSDPPTVSTTKVSGALTELQPGAHVALVWRNHSVLAVGNDVPLDAAGNFAFELSAPPAEYLNGFEADGSEDAGLRPVHTQTLTPLDTVQGATNPTGTPLTFANAGFLVYQDANGNGQLDLDPASGETPDQIVGGSTALTLVYYAGGSEFDYEKLRANGVTPQPGFNLSYTTGWLDLTTAFELESLATGTMLPGAVCGPVGTENVRAGIDDSHGPYLSYPSPSTVTCSADGHSFTSSDVGWPATVCTADRPNVCAGYGMTNLGASCHTTDWAKGNMPAGAALPPGWPCTSDGKPVTAAGADAGP